MPTRLKCRGFVNRLVSDPDATHRQVRHQTAQDQHLRNPMAHVPAVLYEMPALEHVLMGGTFPRDEVAKLQKALPRAKVR